MVDLIKIQKDEVFLKENDKGSEAYYLISGKMGSLKILMGKV